MALPRYQIPERVFGAFQTEGTVEMVKAADVEAVLKQVVEQLEVMRECTYLDAEPPELRAQNQRCHQIACQLLDALRGGT